MTAKVKIITTMFGPLPDWYPLYEAQMRRFRFVDWELVPSPSVPGEQRERHLDIHNRRIEKTTGAASRKNAGSVCDTRPLFGEIFASLYAGYEWWGWADIDIAFGDLDRLLPPLLENVDVLSFKPSYLSGCFALFRSTPKTTQLFRLGPWQDILYDPAYHIWDESGHPRTGGHSFWGLLHKVGLRVRVCEDLMLYDALEEPHPAELRDGRVYAHDGREVLFHHFMTKVWPFHHDGRSRFA